jgi:hypothetical protein
MERSKKYAGYTDDEILNLSLVDLPLESQSYLAIELQVRGLAKDAKTKKIEEIKSKRSYRNYVMAAFMAVFLWKIMSQFF